MNANHNESSSPLQPEVHWNLRRRLPALVFAASIIGFGGFVGGFLTSYGPRYLNIHVTQAFHNDDVDRSDAEVVRAAEPDPSAELAVSQEDLPPGAEARLLMHGQGKSYVVLDTKPSTSWGVGPKRVRGDDFYFTVTQDVAADAVAPKLGAWQGRQLNLYGRRGYACSAKVSGFALLQASFEDGENADTVLREFVEGTFQLVAELEPLRGQCLSAIWARDASLPAPALGRVASPTRSLGRQALKQYRQTPVWTRLQRKFARQGRKGKWDRYLDADPTVVAISGASEEVILVSADKRHCGEFDGALSLLFRVQADGSLLALDGADVFVADFQAGADFDGDGYLDFVGTGPRSETLLVRQGPALSVESSLKVLVNVRGC